MTITPAAPLVAAAVLPLETAKLQARVDGNDEDQLLESMWLSALRWVETYTSRSLTLRAWVATFDGFGWSMRLPVGPVVSVEGVTYRDGGGVSAVLPSGGWRIAGDVLAAGFGTAWPGVHSGAGAVTVEFTAGYQNVKVDAPELMTAALMLFAHLMNNREAVTAGQVPAEVPFGVEMLCNAYRMPVIG